MIGVGIKTVTKITKLLTKKKVKIPKKPENLTAALKAARLKKKPVGFWKGQWLETKTEGRSLWKGTKRLPKRLFKAGWKHPIAAGVVIGGGGGLLLGQKRLRYGYGNNKPKKT